MRRLCVVFLFLTALVPVTFIAFQSTEALRYCEDVNGELKTAIHDVRNKFFLFPKEP